MSTEWHAIVTADPHTQQRRRYDLPGARSEAEREARERHGHELGVDTDNVRTRYLGVVPGTRE